VQEDQVAESCQVTSVIPATYEQDQFSLNLDHRFTADNKVSAKFFYTDQPSRDPLADDDALTLQEALEDTAQTAFSLTDTHIFGPTVVNEFRRCSATQRHGARDVLRTSSSSRTSSPTWSPT
jgi:hypothetical protein